MADQPEGHKAENTGDFEGQASLFPARVARQAALRAESPVVDADEGEIERKFGGRRAGARNVATTKRLELFARIGGDPLLAAARVLAMSLDDLATMLGCSTLEAAEFQQRERYQAMPYVLSKRPQEISVETKTPPALHLHFPAGAGGAQLPGGGAVALLAQAAARFGRGADVIEGEAEELGISDA